MLNPLSPLAVTASPQLAEALRLSERHSGINLDFASTIRQGRPHATHRAMIIIGADQLGRVRKPWRCRGLVVAISLQPWTASLLTQAERAGVTYALELPRGFPVLIDALLDSRHARLEPPPEETY